MKKWTMRDGTKIAIKDMDDKHLVNTIRLIERKVSEKYGRDISCGYKMLGFLQGEQALMDVESSLDQMEEDGPEYPVEYQYLLDEANKRKLFSPQHTGLKDKNGKEICGVGYFKR